MITSPSSNLFSVHNQREMLQNIRFTYFFIAFAIGLFFCYILTPAPEVVIKFPSPQNAGKVMYRDKSDTCYTYRADAVECPMDTSKIKSQPIQEDFRAQKRNMKTKMIGNHEM